MFDEFSISRRGLMWGAVGCCIPPVAVGCASDASIRFRPPFQVSAPARLVRVNTAVDAPDPVKKLGGKSRYDKDDEARAEVDEDRAEAYEEAVAPLRAFEREVIKHANNYVESRGSRPEEAARTAGLLHRWADSDALKNMRTEQAEANRAWATCRLSLAWLQVRDAIDPADNARDEVERWLHRLGKRVRKDQQNKDEDEASGRNNHRYWAGLAAANAGVIAGDGSLFDWGVDSARVGIDQVDARGALPLELARGPRALYYHAYALGPLLMVAEIAARNGRSLYEENDAALHRLVNFTLRGIEDPSTVAEIVDETQEPLGSDGAAFDPHDVAWLEIYAHRFPGRNPWRARMPHLRPLSYVRLGGNLTAIYSGSQQQAQRENQKPD